MKVLMHMEGNCGYGADQVEGMTLGDLLESVKEAVTEWGEDAEVVLLQINNRYGANFGRFASYDLFRTPDDNDNDEY